MPSDPPWWSDDPPRHRDIRRLVSGGPTLEKLQAERDERVRILRGSQDIEHWRLADALANAEPGKPVDLGACPLNARHFQIYAASQILEQLEPFPDLYMVTVADGREAIGAEELKSLDWRRHHNRLRRRIDRSVSSATVGVGIGELEFHDTTKTFHPHHHLFWGTSAETNWRVCAGITNSSKALGLQCVSILFQTCPANFLRAEDQCAAQTFFAHESPAGTRRSTSAP